MTERAVAFAEGWSALGPGAMVDIAAEMTKLTLQIITRTMFSADAGEMGDMVGDAMHRGQEQLLFSLLDILPVIGKWHIAGTMKRVHTTFSELDAAMYRLIEARGKTPAGAPRDLLDRLIAARDSETGIGMTDHEIRDEVVIIFLAGHRRRRSRLRSSGICSRNIPTQRRSLRPSCNLFLAAAPPRTPISPIFPTRAW